MPDPNYLSEIEREDGTILTIRDAEAHAAIDEMNPTLQQILQGVNDIKSSIGDVGEIVEEVLVGPPTLIEKTITENGTYNASDDDADGYSSVTVDVSGGGAGGTDVIFYDYDGTIVQTYSAADFANLSAMPANPTHEGLTAQGWNLSLADAKAYVAANGKLNIGQMYITSDGKTRLYISLPEGRTSPILQLYLNANSEVDIDWGDGGAHSTFNSTSADYKSERHEYSTYGDYVIAITVVSGGFVLQSSSMSVSSILWNGNDSTSSPDRAYNNAIKKIEIGNNVTSIGNSAFNNCYSLSSVTIPDSVTSIGSSAFSYCYSLSSITIPDSVTSISSSAFNYCYSLSSVTIPDGITRFAAPFNNCSSLTSITIPDGVTDFGSYAFQNCYSLSSVTIPDSVTSISDSAFANCYSLSSVTIPDSVTSIGNSAFNNCYSLTSITIPEGVTSIVSNAFNNCYSLSSVTIPDSVTSIGNGAFKKCQSLTSITIPEGVTSIVSNAFNNCYSLSSVTIPDSVTSISDSAFANCYSLTSITIPDSVTSIGNSAFKNCQSLTSITIPNTVTSIVSNAFNNCYSLSSVTIPDSVTSIGNSAFFNCYSLTSITIPDSVTSIDSNAFSSCSYMSYIKFESTTPPAVSSSSAWSGVSTSTKILVPTGTLETYKAATNYPNPSTYTYEEY